MQESEGSLLVLSTYVLHLAHLGQQTAQDGHLKGDGISQSIAQGNVGGEDKSHSHLRKAGILSWFTWLVENRGL